MPFSARSRKAPALPVHSSCAQFIFGNISGKHFDQFIAWKAERKSRSTVPPWAEASGRVCYLLWASTRAGFTAGLGIPVPVFCRVKDILTAKRPLPPKKGLQVWELLAVLNHSSHPSTRGCVLLGEGDKQPEKATALERNFSGKRERDSLDEQRARTPQEQSSCGHRGLFISEGFSEVKTEKVSLQVHHENLLLFKNKSRHSKASLSTKGLPAGRAQTPICFASNRFHFPIPMQIPAARLAKTSAALLDPKQPELILLLFFFFFRLFKPPSTNPTRNWKHFQGLNPFKVPRGESHDESRAQGRAGGPGCNWGP